MGAGKMFPYGVRLDWHGLLEVVSFHVAWSLAHLQELFALQTFIFDSPAVLFVPRVN